MQSNTTWLSSIHAMEPRGNEDPNKYADLLNKAVDKFAEIEPPLIAAILRVQVVCSAGLSNQLDDLAKTFRTVFYLVIGEGTREEVNNMTDTAQQKMTVLINLVRAELEVGNSTNINIGDGRN